MWLDLWHGDGSISRCLYNAHDERETQSTQGGNRPPGVPRRATSIMKPQEGSLFLRELQKSRSVAHLLEHCKIRKQCRAIVTSCYITKAKMGRSCSLPPASATDAMPYTHAGLVYSIMIGITRSECGINGARSGSYLLSLRI